MARSSAKRIAKHVAHDLIKYAKSLTIKAPYYLESSTSAYEFHRQMNSPNLKQKNDAFEVKVILEEDESKPTLVSAEFLDGSKIEVDAAQYDAMQLRHMFFEAAKEAEGNL